MLRLIFGIYDCIMMKIRRLRYPRLIKRIEAQEREHIFTVCDPRFFDLLPKQEEAADKAHREMMKNKRGQRI